MVGDPDPRAPGHSQRGPAMVVVRVVASLGGAAVPGPGLPLKREGRCQLRVQTRRATLLMVLGQGTTTTLYPRGYPQLPHEVGTKEQEDGPGRLGYLAKAT